VLRLPVRTVGRRSRSWQRQLICIRSLTLTTSRCLPVLSALWRAQACQTPGTVTSQGKAHDFDPVHCHSLRHKSTAQAGSTSTSTPQRRISSMSEGSSSVVCYKCLHTGLTRKFCPMNSPTEKRLLLAQYIHYLIFNL